MKSLINLHTKRSHQPCSFSWYCFSLPPLCLWRGMHMLRYVLILDVQLTAMAALDNLERVMVSAIVMGPT
ncbi:hypothetical protein CHS0354_009302 [Potamilus streckersoni]|uniref:Uncharacterized protein n=1 Tax=Potamilus streckersoni TaxID=2493646 RepID=A0AAE0VZG7_9BIVA|nr:hypothetical protein CHS0354_009302 [Potamilus streckersoni]